MGLFSKEESRVEHGYYLIDRSTNRIFRKQFSFVKQADKGIYRVDRKLEEALEFRRGIDVNDMPLENIANQENESFYVRIKPAVEHLIDQPGFYQAINGLLDKDKIRDRLLSKNANIRRQYLYYRIGKEVPATPKITLFVGTIGYDGNEVYKAYTPKDEKFHTKIAKKEISYIDEYIHNAHRTTAWEENCRNMGAIITDEEANYRKSRMKNDIKVEPINKVPTDEGDNTNGQYVPRHARKGNAR